MHTVFFGRNMDFISPFIPVRVALLVSFDGEAAGETSSNLVRVVHSTDKTRL